MSVVNEVLAVLQGIYDNEVEDYILDFYNEPIINIIKNTITEEVYNTYSPSQYGRTYELRESVGLLYTEYFSGTVWFVYGHDESKMNRYTPSENPKLGRGWSLRATKEYPKGSDFSPYIPWAIHEGESGDIWGVRNPAWYAPKPYMEKAGDKIKNDYDW